MKYYIISLAFLFSFGIVAQTNQKKIDSLQNVIKKTTSVKDKTTALLLLGETYLSVNIDSSLSVYKRAKRNAEMINDDQLLFKSTIGIGGAFTKLTKNDSAYTYYEKAEKLLNSESSYDDRTTLWMNRGILHFYQGDYNKAAKEFEAVLELALIEDNKDDISRCYNNLALCSSYTGNYEKALKMHIQSANLAESQKDTLSLARSYNNIGLIYHDLEDPKKAEEYILKSLALKEQLGDNIGVIGAYLNLGNNKRKIGLKDMDSLTLTESKNYYLKALELGKKANYMRGNYISYSSLALIENNLGNYEKGVEYGEFSLKLSLESKDENMEAISRINLGDSYRLTGKLSKAEDQLLKGLALTEKSSDLDSRKDVLLILSRLYAEKKDFEKAYNYFIYRSEILDSIASVEVKGKVIELEAKYENEKKENKILAQRAQLAEKDLEVRRKNTLIYGVIGFSIILALLGYLFYSQQKLKNRQLQKEGELKTALAKIETQNRLQEQRLRISRDLHDNIGSQLTFIISSVDNLKYGLKDAGEKTIDKLSIISAFTSNTIYELRDTIWAMNKNQITWEDLQARISNFIEKANTADDKVSFNFSIAKGTVINNEFTSVQGMNMYRIIQEAINNALKYAEASVVSVVVSEKDKHYTIIIEDNGNGFNEAEIESGNGLANIRKRAKDLNGKATITSEKGKGTKVVITFKIV
jgi:signal transduction histidine kinase